jgi:hypothetical protein
VAGNAAARTAIDANGRSRSTEPKAIIEGIPDDLKAETVEHTLHRDGCPCCRKQVEPKVPDTLPNCTLGRRSVALSAWPREVREVDEGDGKGGDWPEFRKRLRRLHGDAVRLTAARATPPVDAYDLRCAKLHGRMVEPAVAEWPRPAVGRRKCPANLHRHRPTPDPARSGPFRRLKG